MTNFPHIVAASTLFSQPCAEHFFAYEEGNPQGVAMENVECEEGDEVRITSVENLGRAAGDGMDINFRSQIVGYCGDVKLVGTFYNEQKFEAALKQLGIN